MNSMWIGFFRLGSKKTEEESDTEKGRKDKERHTMLGELVVEKSRRKCWFVRRFVAYCTLHPKCILASSSLTTQLQTRRNHGI